VPKETQSSLANDVRDVELVGTMQDFIVGYEVVPSDVQDASSAPYMERITLFVLCVPVPTNSGFATKGNSSKFWQYRLLGTSTQCRKQKQLKESVHMARFVR